MDHHIFDKNNRKMDVPEFVFHTEDVLGENYLIKYNIANDNFSEIQKDQNHEQNQKNNSDLFALKTKE